MLGARVPDNETLARTLAPQYELVHTIFHRRTGEPVLWIYGRKEQAVSEINIPAPSIPNTEHAR
jgi:hypothetical protein